MKKNDMIFFLIFTRLPDTDTLYRRSRQIIHTVIWTSELILKQLLHISKKQENLNSSVSTLYNWVQFNSFFLFFCVIFLLTYNNGEVVSTNCSDRHIKAWIFFSCVNRSHSIIPFQTLQSPGFFRICLYLHTILIWHFNTFFFVIFQKTATVKTYHSCIKIPVQNRRPTLKIWTVVYYNTRKIQSSVSRGASIPSSCWGWQWRWP